jgi:hypothetical protein
MRMSLLVAIAVGLSPTFALATDATNFAQRLPVACPVGLAVDGFKGRWSPAGGRGSPRFGFPPPRG